MVRKRERERGREKEIKEMFILAAAQGRISAPSWCWCFRRISDTTSTHTRSFIPSWPDYRNVSVTITDPQWMMGVNAHVWHPCLLKWHDVKFRLKDSTYFP